MATSKHYCSKVCGAKCCHIYVGSEAVRCPQLSDDNLCRVYEQRYVERGDEAVVVVGSWTNKGIKDINGDAVHVPCYCGRIEDLLAKGLISEEVKKGCWYSDEVQRTVNSRQDDGKAGA